MKKNILNYSFLFLSPLLLALSYPKYSLWPLAWIGLIPIFILFYKSKNIKEVFLYSFIFGLSFYSIILYWIVPTLLSAKVSLWLSFFSLFLLSAFLSFEFVLIFLFSFKFKKYSIFMTGIFLTSLWVLIDFLKIQINKFAFYFPWFSISFSQWKNLNMLNYSFYGGFYLINALIILPQILIAGYYVKRKSNKEFFIKTIYFITFVFLINFIGSKIYIKEKENSEKIKITILQPSIEVYRKWDKRYEEEIKTKLEGLLLKAYKENPDLILWPENALPGWINDEEIFSWLKENIKKGKAYHILGSVSMIEGKYVSAFLLDKDANIISEYHKRILVPFGEYVPLKNILEKYIKPIGELGEFEKGSLNQNLFIVKGFKISPTICYESVFDFLFYKENKADFFVNLTNDGWYLNTWAPYQHLAILTLRATENKKYIARAGNNGISSLIMPNGEINSSLNLNEVSILNIEIPKQIKNQEEIFPKYSIIYLSLMIIISFLFVLVFI